MLRYAMILAPAVIRNANAAQALLHLPWETNKD
jgi:hypothetical protein